MHASTPSIRALYVQPGALFGGAERQAATNIPLLPAFGVDVVPLVGPGRAIVDWLRERGVADFVYSDHFPGAWRKPRGLARASLPFLYARSLVRLSRTVERLAREREVDLIYAALSFSWVSATPVARRLGLPVAWRAGGTEVTPWEKAALRAFAALSPPDLLICCSEAVRRAMAPLVPAPARVVMNGVDTAQFHPDAGDADACRPSGCRLVVGFAARLVPQKRPEDFLAMAARVAARFPGVGFILAGEGSRRPEYEARARELGLGDRVRFLGYVADMQSFYRACDVFVLPSRSEGCPNVVLEAMAMRRALVVSDAAGTREVLTHGRDGLFYRIGDTCALAAAVARLVADEALRTGLARSGYERVTRELSATACARQVAALLHATASAASGPGRTPGMRRSCQGPPSRRPMPLAQALAGGRTSPSTPA